MIPTPRESVVARAEGDPLPITVIIPAYNRADTVARAVASALAQRPSRPAEVVVVDDGSADDTAEVARRAGARVIRHSVNRRLGAARNTGLSNATQPWIALLDSDDEWLPHHLALLWPLRGRHVLLAASALRCSPDGQHLHLGPPEPGGRALRSAADVAASSIIVVSAVIVRRDAVESAGGFREFHGPLHGVEDVDLWLRLLEHGTGYVSARVSVLYHEHGAQMSSDGNRLQLARRMVLESYSARPWFRPQLLDEWDGVMGWDAARLASESGDGRVALRHLGRVARRSETTASAPRVSSASDTQRAGGLRRSPVQARIRSPWWTRQRRLPRPPPASAWSSHPVGRSSRATPRSPAVLRPRSWWMGGPNACSSGSWECGQSAELRGRGGGSAGG